MARLTALLMSQDIDLVTAGSADFIDFQTAVSATAASYVFQTDRLPPWEVRLTGSFTGPAGSATGTATGAAIAFTAPGGPADITITDILPLVPLQNLTQGHALFWRSIFFFHDSFTVGGEDFTSVLVGDALVPEVSQTGGNDTFQGGGVGGNYIWYGDHRTKTGSSSAGGGDDHFDMTLAEAGNDSVLTGDLQLVGAGGYLGGDDAFAIAMLDEAALEIRGDAGEVAGGTLFGGDDSLTITVATQSGLPGAFEVVGEARNLTGGSIVGGADRMAGAGRITGDVIQMTGGSLRAGDDSLTGSIGNDRITGDILSLINAGAATSVMAGHDILTGGRGDDRLVGDIDTVGGSAVTPSVFTLGDDRLYGGAGVDSLYGDLAGLTMPFATAAGGHDGLYGGDDNDNLYGGAGNDTLDGGGGRNYLDGGAGDDLFLVSSSIEILALGGLGFDRLFTTVSFSLQAGVGIDRMEAADIASTAAIDLGGNELAQTIVGNAGNNRLSDGGGAQADSLIGGSGNDSYIIRQAATLVSELAGGGTDRLSAGVSLTLGAGQEIEELTTTSSAGTAAISLTGNLLAQTITGNQGANSLSDGGGAADRLAGLGGADLYVVRAAGTLVEEAAGAGTDRVAAAVDVVLGAGQEIEELTTTSSTGTAAISLTGNGLAQTITGNDGANVLSDGGGAGADSLVGRAGADHYILRNGASLITETAGNGADRVSAAVTFRLGFDDDIEQMTTTASTGTGAINLTGNALAQTLIGNDGANRLSGLGGADLMTGRGGADSFVFDAAFGSSNVDRITDYVVADDQIVLDDDAVAPLPSGALAAAAFVANGTGQATTAAHRVIYDTDDGVLYFDADGTGAAGRVRFAFLDAGLAMTAAEFLVA